MEQVLSKIEDLGQPQLEEATCSGICVRDRLTKWAIDTTTGKFKLLTPISNPHFETRRPNRWWKFTELYIRQDFQQEEGNLTSFFSYGSPKHCMSCTLCTKCGFGIIANALHSEVPNP